MSAGVDAASAVIEAIIAENYSITVSIEDADVVGSLVGKKGEAIKKFQVSEPCVLFCACIS